MTNNCTTEVWDGNRNRECGSDGRTFCPRCEHEANVENHQKDDTKQEAS